MKTCIGIFLVLTYFTSAKGGDYCVDRKCPAEILYFSRDNQTLDYARFKTSLPQSDEYTVCGWFDFGSVGVLEGTVFSYATEEQPQEIVIYGHNGTNYIIYKGTILAAASNFGTYCVGFEHMCVVINGQVKSSTKHTYYSQALVYINDRPPITFTEFTTPDVSYAITNPGVVVLGQKQGYMAGDFDPNYAYVGRMESFKAWSRALSDNDVFNEFNRLFCGTEDINFDIKNLQLFGLVAWMDQHSKY